MAKPVVAIVGRPNVGKSTLFNKLIGTRLSIVDDTPGVTRDRIYGDCEWLNHKFLLVDTGGIEPNTSDVILSQMRTQAEIAISTADVIILVTNIRDGVVASDYDVATMLQKSGKPIILCVNKCDSIGEPDPEFYEFYNLGLGDPVAVSAAHGHGTGDLLDEVLKYLPENDEEEDDDEVIKVAIIGKPNVGKSSFINRISKRTTAGVGNRPGVTKQKQWIRINEKIELLDTPGVLWPKFESEEVALHLCFTGTIKEEILDKIEIAYQLTKFLLENYRKKLCERYKLDENYVEETLNQEQPENNNIYEIMIEIGKKRGCIMSGGRIDEEKTSRLILDEFKNGKLGKMTIEQP